MLTCDLCGEEMMLEEDMKTHVLLSHVELDLQCPLCSLSGVTYDELCFHISSAHPDNPPDPDPSCSTTDTTIVPPALDPGRSKQKQPPPPAITSPFSSVGTRTFECPMCPVVCSDSATLQEHVELHLDCEAGGAAADLALAQKIQQELEQQRLEDEAQKERQEFKRLQRQFGVDGGQGGGFRRQMERTMERAVSRGLMAPAEFHWRRAELMESLASGLDDGTTRTQGVMACLSHFFQSGCRGHVWLSADTDYFCSSPGDRGWGCGYRNFQMLLSSLSRIETYTAVLQGKDVPSVPQVQHMIEEAWRGGLDPQGASHFNQRLQGTRAWIGATEIYVLLTSLGISARIIDFHQPTGAAGTHPRLFDWVKQYFSQASGGSRPQTPLTQTSLPPLYLQHQGHSRCVVGLEQQKNGSLCLLLFDPGSCPSETRKLTSRDSISSSIRHIRHPLSSIKQQQYQLVSVEGVLSAEDKQIRVLNSRTLRAERIS